MTLRDMQRQRIALHPPRFRVPINEEVINLLPASIVFRSVSL